MLTYLFIALLVGIVAWRVILPNMKLRSGKTKASGGSNNDVLIASIVFGVILTSVLILGYWMWPSSTPPTPSAPSASGTGWSWSPSIGDVWEWAMAGWVWIFILAFITWLVSYFVSEKEKKWDKALKTVAIMLPVIFVGLWLGNMVWGESSSSQQVQKTASQECTSASPCTTTLRTNGSTDRTNIPQGKSVCFEPFFWNNIQRLGYKTSYKGGDVGGTGVSADTFWFVPEGEMKVPRHWFVQESATQC